LTCFFLHILVLFLLTFPQCQTSFSVKRSLTSFFCKIYNPWNFFQRREKLHMFFLTTILPLLLPLHLSCFFKLFPICDLCYKKKSCWAFLGVEKLVEFFFGKILHFFPSFKHFLLFFPPYVRCLLHKNLLNFSWHRKKLTKFLLKNYWSSFPLSVFLFFQSLICLFSLTILNPHNPNGGWSIVIQHDNPSGVELNKDQHGEIIEKYKISPKHKACMDVPLCRMVPMLVVRLALKIDILKMEQAFHMGYREGDEVFYLFPTSWKGEEQNVSLHIGTSNEYWVIENERFQKVLREDSNLVHFSNKIFLCGMGTTAFRLGCHTLADCTVMIHSGFCCFHKIENSHLVSCLISSSWWLSSHCYLS